MPTIPPTTHQSSASHRHFFVFAYPIYLLFLFHSSTLRKEVASQTIPAASLVYALDFRRALGSAFFCSSFFNLFFLLSRRAFCFQR